MNWLTRLWGRITEYLTTQADTLSSRVRIVTRRFRSTFRTPSHDWGRSDYSFWRKAYYCQSRGLEISGLFIKPLVNKIAGWTLGRAPIWKTGNAAGDAALQDWMAAHHAELVDALRGSLKQGDQFIIVNSDLSLAMPPPETVDPLVAEDDYSRIIGWRVTQVFAHPQTNARMVVTDEYYADRRVQRVEINSSLRRETVYPNLLGRVPVVLVANQTQDGETFGHAEAEALLEVLQRYGEIFEAAIEGNITQGRPTPVASFATQADLDKFWELYGENETQTLPDGATETTPRLDVDLSQLLTLTGATFEYKAPGSFTQDTERLLGLMFYLILEHTELPEFVFGNAISSSKASTETQMPVFERFIELRRAQAARWLNETAEIVLGYLSLTTPGITAATPTLQWPVLAQDKRLTLDTLVWALREGLLDDETALSLSPLDVQDAPDLVRRARRQQTQRAEMQSAPAVENGEQMDAALQAEIERLNI